MVVGIISVLVGLALAVLFGWLTRRAWRSRRALVKWGGAILAGVLTLLLALVTIVALIGFYKLYLPVNYPVSNIKVAASADQVARGQDLAHICAGCHSTTNGLPLDGSSRNFLGQLGTLYPPNLTPAGPLKDWTDGQVIRAIREGVDKNGRPLIVMPASQFHGMSDVDVQAVVAFLRSQPAVQHDTPATNLGPIAMLIIGGGVFATSQQPPITQPIVAPPAGTPDHGRYLVSISGCRACHGDNLAGGTPGGFTPVGPNLTALIPKWSQADFILEFRTGVDPTGHQLSDQMPWKQYAETYSDPELADIYSYLHGLTPVQK